MAKQAKVVSPESAPAVPAPESAAPPVGKLVVKAGMVYRGKRQAYYEALLALAGSTKAEVLAAFAAKPPGLYTERSKFVGTPEAPSGWVRWFEKSGVASWQ